MWCTVVQVREILGQAAQAEICGSTYMYVCTTCEEVLVVVHVGKPCTPTRNATTTTTTVAVTCIKIINLFYLFWKRRSIYNNSPQYVINYIWTTHT